MVFKIIKCVNHKKNGCPVEHAEKEGAKKLAPCSKCGGGRYYSSKWYVRLKVGGKNVVRAVSSKKDDAIKYEQNLMDHRRMGSDEFAAQRPLTVEEAYNKAFGLYCELKVSQDKLAESSAKCYRYRLEKNVIPLIGHVKLKLVSHFVVNKFVSDRLAQTNKRGVLPKKSTVNRDVTALMVLIQAAVENGLLDRSPLSGYKLMPENNGRDRVLSAADINGLLRECRVKLASNGKPSNESPPEYLETLVILALNTGLRKEGCLGLRWEHIDWADGVITRVVKHKRAAGEKSVTIPMTPVLRLALDAWRRRGGITRMSGLVFPSSKTGEQILVTSNIGFDAAVKRAGLAPLVFHDLRHTFVTLFVQAGNDITLAQEIVGHSSSHMTKRYTHLMKDHKKAAMANFGLGGGADVKSKAD